MADSLIDQLRRERPEYRRECEWLAFLADAYTGGGGFQGKVRQPESGYWGAAAEQYASSSSVLADASRASLSNGSYLDRFHREDQPKYDARRDLAHYLNYVEPLTDLKVSYMLRKPFTRVEEPAEIEAWRADIDGEGTSYDDLRPQLATNAAVLGWTPLLIDRPVAPPGLSAAQARDIGADRFLVHQLSPANILEWSERGGKLLWAKTRVCSVDVAGWNMPPIKVEEISVWYPDHVERWVIRAPEKGDPVVESLGSFTHPFKRVPLAIFRHKRVPSKASCVVGLPMHAQVSLVARRLFNLTSEFDEHIRQQVFAILVLPRMPGQAGDVSVGSTNGLECGPEQKNVPYYLAPPATVADTLEKRVESTVKEIYRMARVEFSRPTGGSTASGVALAYEFAQTNRAIGDFAAEFARGETDVIQIVGTALGISEDRLKKAHVVAPSDFSIDDLAADLKAAADAVSLGIGPTATVEVKYRAIEQLLPHAPAETMAKIRRELDEAAKQPPPAPPPAPPAPPGNKPPQPPAPPAA